MKKIAPYLTILAALGYALLGILLLFTNKFVTLQNEVRILLGIVLLLYSAYRLARFFFVKKQTEDFDNS
jgi:hypothetical protein